MDELWSVIPKAFHATVKNSQVLKWITDVLRENDRRIKELEASVLHLKMEAKARRSPEATAALTPARITEESPAHVTADMTAEEAWENM